MDHELNFGDVAVEEADVHTRMHRYQTELNEHDPLIPVPPKNVRKNSSGARVKFAIAAVAISALSIGGAAVLMSADKTDVSTASAAEEPPVQAPPASDQPADDQPIAPAPKVVLDGATLPFNDDTAVLTSPDEAKAKLSLIAASVRNSDQKIKLTGTTATDGTEAGRARLSLARAESVKRLLIDLGVPAARITTEGVGINNPGHVVDRDENNRLIPDKAAANRTVILTIDG